MHMIWRDRIDSNCCINVFDKHTHRWICIYIIVVENNEKLDKRFKKKKDHKPLSKMLYIRMKGKKKEYCNF